MAPIRIGFIGLTASPGSWAESAHWPYLAQSSKYKVVALANSSKASAEAAIKAHGLPADVKAYGSPTDIAADPDVDMVVVSVKVAMHYSLVKPALEAGKMAYVEWPLGINTGEAEELTELAKRKNLKTIVGLQSRRSNITRTLKEIVSSEKLGKVLSSHVVGETGNLDTTIPEKYRYFVDPEVGGNHFTISLGHFLDSFVDVLGDFVSPQALLAIQRPLVDLVADGKVVDTIHKGTADHTLIQGRLESGAVASISLRAGKPAGLVWKIFCEKGEICLEAPGAAIQWSYEKDTVSIRIYDNESGESERVEIADMELEQVKTPARMIGRLYEAFASGDEGSYSSFEDALAHHRRLDVITNGAVHFKREK